MAIKKNNLMAEWQATEIRTGAANVPVGGSYRCDRIEYGAPPTVVLATGRGSCRACGCRIAKGARAIKFFWDVGGCGSFTATETHIHAEDCTRRYIGPGICKILGIVYVHPTGLPHDLRVAMRDVAEKSGCTWTPAQAEAYDAYVKRIVQQYRKAQAQRTPEQRAEEAYERRAAFGPGVDTVNVLTGERNRT